MTQRNPLNERYTDENRKGQTRKSAASAKAVTKAASSVHEAPEKSKKQKKAEQEARERKIRERRGVTGSNISEAELRQLPEYKKLRRLWWVFLGLSIALTASTWVFASFSETGEVSMIPLILAWIFIIAAFYIDIWKIRKLRNRYRYANNDKSKATRAAQKQHAAEMRERQKQQAANPTPPKPTLMERITNLFSGSKKTAQETAAKAAEGAEESTAAQAK